jgi:hypothetical protein
MKDLQREKVEAEKTHDAQIAESCDKFQKFHLHFHTRLCELHKELEVSR